MKGLVLSVLLLAALLSAGCAASSAPAATASPTSPTPPPAATANPTSPTPAAATTSPSAPGTGNSTPQPGGNSTPRAGITLAPRQPSATPPPAGELNVTFERSGGFTGRNDLFHLKADGSVDDGKIVLHAAGGAAAAAALASQLAASGIYAVTPGRYLGAHTCCDRFEYDLTLVQNGRTYAFVTLSDEPSAPPALVQAIHLILQYIDAAN